MSIAESYRFRIDQVLPSFRMGDAIGLECYYMREAIRSLGILSDIFAIHREEGAGALPMHEFLAHDSHDRIVIHHFSVGCDLPYHLIQSKAYFVLRYHNITPPQFFEFPTLEEARATCAQGRSQIPFVESFSRSCWPVSKYNSLELNCARFDNTEVLPVIHPFERLTRSPISPELNSKFDQNPGINILFVGRVVPNKGHHDLMFYLQQIQRQITSRKVRLLCVGMINEYYFEKKLTEVARYLGLTISSSRVPTLAADVIFTGGVSEVELATYFENADVFFSCSDHEGFGVPLIESMFFGIPVIAHDSSAIAETLAGAGLLINKNHPKEHINSIVQLLSDEDRHQQYGRSSLEGSKKFAWDKLLNQFYRVLESLPPIQKRNLTFSQRKSTSSKVDLL
ncbi:MAG: glycosyltransferase [Zetaproteobacteria bacterium]|nr:glycosyltransferase [Zetaproteobacteria bacterium]